MCGHKKELARKENESMIGGLAWHSMDGCLETGRPGQQGRPNSSESFERGVKIKGQPVIAGDWQE